MREYTALYQIDAKETRESIEADSLSEALDKAAQYCEGYNDAKQTLAARVIGVFNPYYVSIQKEASGFEARVNYDASAGPAPGF